MWVEPIQNNSQDLDSVAVQLLDKLILCRTNAGQLPKEHSGQLQECFTNLLTYVNQIIQLSKEKHSSRCFKSLTTQTDIFKQFDVGIQTENRTEPKKDKNVQTLNNQYRNVLVQTEVQSPSKPREESVVSLAKTSKIVVEPGKFSLLQLISFCKEFHSFIDGSGQKLNKKKSSSRISSQSKPSQTSKSSEPAHISEDESKDKSSKTNISEGSELLISLGSSKSLNKKINRKLVYEDPKPDRLEKNNSVFVCINKVFVENLSESKRSVLIVNQKMVCLKSEN